MIFYLNLHIFNNVTSHVVMSMMSHLSCSCALTIIKTQSYPTQKRNHKMNCGGTIKTRTRTP